MIDTYSIAVYKLSLFIHEMNNMGKQDKAIIEYFTKRIEELKTITK